MLRLLAAAHYFLNTYFVPRKPYATWMERHFRWRLMRWLERKAGHRLTLEVSNTVFGSMTVKEFDTWYSGHYLGNLADLKRSNLREAILISRSFKTSLNDTIAILRANDVEI